MLSPEQRAALMERLSQSDTPEPQVETPEPQTETPEPQVETPAPVSPEPQVDPQPQAPKMVPLEDLARVRQERRQLRDELAKTREQLARLEGEREARKQASPSWVDEALAEPEPEVDPDRQFLQQLKAEREAEANNKLLEQVVNLVKTADPTMDENYLLEQLALKRTPEQAVLSWQAMRQRFVPGQQAQTPPTVRPPVPPTVAKAPATAGQPKPTNWRDVSNAVRQKLERG